MNEATFVPPPPDQVARHLSDLEKFLHTDAPLPLLVKIGIAHVQFETIHPFLDGNGRIGRLLISFLLCEQRVLLKPVLYLSHYFKRHRQMYYELLQAVRDDGAWEAWLAFFLEGVKEVSEQATETARQILSLRRITGVSLPTPWDGPLVTVTECLITCTNIRPSQLQT